MAGVDVLLLCLLCESSAPLCLCGSRPETRSRMKALTGQTDPCPTYLIVGVSHRTGTAALRERLFADEAGQTELLAALRAAGLHQGLVLSTCDRTELHAVADDSAKAAAAMRDILARQGRVTAADIAAQGYELANEAALRQLFAVASSL